MSRFRDGPFPLAVSRTGRASCPGIRVHLYLLARHVEADLQPGDDYRYRLHTVSADTGLSPADVTTLVTWARSLGGER